MTGYVSHGWNRYRIQQRAGSGNGNTNPCATDEGWLPNGTYSGSGGHGGTDFDLYYKTDRSEVIRGWVWYLGDRQCSNGTWRTELFIHSQGYSGWSVSNYASKGCIKINQVDRGHLADRHNNAYSPDAGTLYVQG